MISKISWMAIFATLALFPVAGISANYTIEEIFETSRDSAPGIERRQMDVGGPLFTFSTLVDKDLVTVRRDDSANPDKPVVLRMEAEGHARLVIEIHRIQFPTFAEAQVAGSAFLGMRGYDRVLQDFAKSNAAFGHLAGATLRKDGSYDRMARLATVSRGREVLFIYAAFDYDDYPAYRETLSRFLGAIEMDIPGGPMDALQVIEAEGGERFAISPEWQIIEADIGEHGRSDYQLSLDGQEYPNIFVTIRPASLEEARTLGAGIIRKYTEQVDASPHAEFAGEAEMNTELGANEEPAAYSYARGIRTVDGALLVSMFRIQTNHQSASSAVIGLNSFDARRGVEGFDADIQERIFKGWVAGSSAFTILARSLQHGIDHVENDFDIRALGH